MRRLVYWVSPVTRCVVLLVLLVLLGSTILARSDEATTMTLEDVVRMHVSGQSLDSIVERIRSSDVDFDLSDEMLDELDVAGIPRPVIEAMVARQRELHPPAAAVEDAGSEAETATPTSLSIRLRVVGASEKEGAPPSLRVADSIGAEARGRLQLSADDARITDLAIFVACTTPTHVPDHWRAESALGRDFISMPRHKLLAFHPGADRDPAAGDAPRGSSVLALEIPPLLEIELEPEKTHDLMVGLAIRAGERYFRVVSATRDEFRPSDHEMSLLVEFRPSKSLDPTALDIRLPTEPERDDGQ